MQGQDLSVQQYATLVDRCRVASKIGRLHCHHRITVFKNGVLAGSVCIAPEEYCEVWHAGIRRYRVGHRKPTLRVHIIVEGCAASLGKRIACSANCDDGGKKPPTGERRRSATAKERCPGRRRQEGRSANQKPPSSHGVPSLPAMLVCKFERLVRVKAVLSAKPPLRLTGEGDQEGRHHDQTGLQHDYTPFDPTTPVA